MVKIKRLNDQAQKPTRADEHSAGYDLYAVVDKPDGRDWIWPGETLVVGSGYAFEIPEGYFGAVYPRSGLSTNHGICLANGVAVIDSSYRGEVKIPLYNASKKKYMVQKGDRVAQIIIEPYLRDELTESEELTQTERGDGGFGHTGR